MKLKKYIAMITVLCFVFSNSAFATNGTRMIGFSARDSGMGGATTASVGDTSCMLRNPANLVRVKNQVNLEYLNILPYATMHTEGALSNAGLRQVSRVDYIPAANGGVSYYIPDMFPCPISIGIGAFTLAGLGVAFTEPRVNTAALLGAQLVQKYDRMFVANTIRTTPTVSLALTDKLSLGLTGNIDVASEKTDLTAGSQFGYRETSGSGKWSHAYGGGFTTGILYQATDMVALGAGYESQSFMSYYDDYKDTGVHYITQPQVVNMGISIKPVKQWEVTFDTRWIDWLSVKAAARGPVQGGFGWKDQWVLATGTEYTFNDKFKVRAGYNYAKSQINEDVVFANALLGLIMEHHLTTGFSYKILENLSFDFAWEHHFRNTMADNGKGDQYSQLGEGTKISTSADIIGVGLTYYY
ncbi:MAG TPA: outer membrane protein transport protein [Candidatus Omnitrophota bacterium]|nr:outer membrane protein transport protein [Candidatus Omnitrophota bacterium]HPS20725.1 outer membrane protein transport protein [Candidatus Omnitrophota bacterium]